MQEGNTKLKDIPPEIPSNAEKTLSFLALEEPMVGLVFCNPSPMKLKESKYE